MTTLLEVRNLSKKFPVTQGLFRRVVGHYTAVDDVSFHIGRGETFGLVGESGCGKTTVGKSLLRLIEPTSGEIRFAGRNVLELSRRDMRRERRNMQIVFQDPYGSLNPRMNVESIVGEPMKKHGLAKGAECSRRVAKLLETVGLSAKEMQKYPHEFSGGQRQRIAIARALSLNPALIVCDEPVSALDVSVQAQILNLMRDLQKEFGIAYLFIAHGMPVVRHISHRVGVMYLGKLVEMADEHSLFTNCRHPYTRALMSAVPSPDPDRKSQRVVLCGEVPSLFNIPKGCRFVTRCPKAAAICSEKTPELVELTQGHFVACHLER